jgi:hypothetical protein
MHGLLLLLLLLLPGSSCMWLAYGLYKMSCSSTLAVCENFVVMVQAGTSIMLETTPRTCWY